VLDGIVTEGSCQGLLTAAKVGERAAGDAAQQHIVRLDVAVHDALVVHVLQALQRSNGWSGLMS